MKIDSHSAIPIHIQITSHFRELIHGGQLAPGSALPSERDLARQYRISRGTVREAMNALVSEGLIERVAGKGTFVLERDKVSIIGAILPSTEDVFAVDILGGVEQTAKQHGCHVLFAQTQENLAQEAIDVQRMREQGVAGFVVFPISSMTHDDTIETLVVDSIPLVLVDRYFPHLAADVVVVDNVDGGYQATRHLIAIGHRRIGFIASASLKTTSVRDRFRGYRQALTEHHIDYDEKWLTTREAALDQYFLAPDRPTAVFASNDLDAIYILSVAEKLGLRVPEDLAVVGFDDRKEAVHLSVPLTTIAQSGYKVGQRACELLLSQLRNPHRPPQHEVLPVHLIVRRSCGAWLKEV
ncbi:MAG: GntR family transcriptional regulator [Anaerolineae bacterium]|nr:GntR family transcriptional regulator [Anaerolineae bacterium]